MRIKKTKRKCHTALNKKMKMEFQEEYSYHIFSRLLKHLWERFQYTGAVRDVNSVHRGTCVSGSSRAAVRTERGADGRPAHFTHPVRAAGAWRLVT